jgi:hypothetical protein
MGHAQTLAATKSLSLSSLAMPPPQRLTGNLCGCGEAVVLTVKIRQPSHEFTFGVGMTFVSYSLVLTPVV